MWEKLHRAVLEELSKQEILAWSRASIDAVSVRAKGGELTGPNPTDRGKPGTKYHLLTNATGLPLHVLASAANTHHSKLFEPLLETNPAVRVRRGRPGQPRRRPEKLHADKGYDYPRCRRYLHRRGIKVRIARRGTEAKTHPGRHAGSWSAPFLGCCGSSASGFATTAPRQLCSRCPLLAVTLITLRRPRQATELRDQLLMRIRQLDAVASRFLAGLTQRAPLLSDSTDTGPAPRFVFVDVDDAIIEVHGYQKQGSGHGHSGVPGLNALLTTASTTDTAPVIPGQRQSEGQCLGPPAFWACRIQLRSAGLCGDGLQPHPHRENPCRWPVHTSPHQHRAT